MIDAPYGHDPGDSGDYMDDSMRTAYRTTDDGYQLYICATGKVLGEFRSWTDTVEAYRRHEVSRLVAKGRRQIKRDVAKGVVPATVARFADLHDYTDANKYGGAFEHDAPPVTDVDLWNEVQGKLDQWIMRGGLR
jgi:hypothetical protein